MVQQLSHFSLKLNSSLKSFLLTLLWMILSIFLLLLHPLNKIKILYYDVLKALSGLDSRKAYGLDGVLPVVLKNCASELTHCLVKLFRLCFSTSTYPSCWKFAHIQLVLKKDDRSKPSNYRPLADILPF